MDYTEYCNALNKLNAMRVPAAAGDVNEEAFLDELANLAMDLQQAVSRLQHQFNMGQLEEKAKAA